MEPQGEQNVPERRRRAPAAVVVLLLGALAVVAGVAIAWSGASQPIGWFAYAPLSDQTFAAPGFAFVGPMTQTGLGIAVAGLLLMAFWAGYRLGRSRN